MGSCEAWPDAYPLNFSGTADAEGRISGVLSTEIYIDASGSKEPYDFDFLGVVSEEGVEVSWDDAIRFDYWEMKVDGAAWAD